jgi:hypothetical protein
VQETYSIPPGRFTEGTIERGHGRVKLNTNCFSRNHSFKAQITDVLTRCLWASDVLLLWERHYGQKMKVAVRKAKYGNDEEEEEEEEEDMLENGDEYYGDFFDMMGN